MYFPARGPANTAQTLELAVRRARELNIPRLVVASCSGRTALALADLAGGLEVVCVTHQAGFAKPGEDEMGEAARRALTERGVKLLTTTHLMAGLDRALRFKFGGVYPAEIIATTLRMFGQGLKVCVEICGMACDAGLVPPGEDVVAVGGSGSGADTAAVISPAHSQHFFDTRVREIVCKPRDF